MKTKTIHHIIGWILMLLMFDLIILFQYIKPLWFWYMYALAIGFMSGWELAE